MITITGVSYILHVANVTSHEQEHLMLAGALTLGIVPFSILMVGLFRRIERHIVRQNEELSDRNRGTQALLNVASAWAGHLELEQMLPDGLDAVLKATGAQAAEIWLADDRSGNLVLRSHRGEAAEAFRSRTLLQPGEGLAGVAAISRRPLRIRDLAADERCLRPAIPASGISVYYAFPLLAAGERVSGVLGIGARHPRALQRQDELRLLELMAEHIAAAVENARLHEEVQALAIRTERERIAMEMHDGLAQVLGYVNIKAQTVKELITAGEMRDAVQQMDQLESAARETYDDVREAILALGDQGQEADLRSALTAYVGKFSELSDLPVEFTADGPALAIAPLHEVQLLRIVQEALANVRKHARARRAEVRISASGTRWTLSISDDGKGFDPGAHVAGPWPHFGLQSMRERAAAIGASFVLDTAPGRGTRVSVEMAGGPDA